MDAAATLRAARQRAGLTLRAHAELAGTSHATLAAYEAGRVVPRVDTLDRLLRAAGWNWEGVLAPRADAGKDRVRKGEELVEALRLAEQFPARHDPLVAYPPFGAHP